MFSQILNQNYPLPKNGWMGITIAILFGVFIASFLIFFKPFHISHSAMIYTNLKISFFGVITAGSVFFFHNCFPIFFPKIFCEQKWKVKHQMFFFVFMLFCISTLNGLYINYLMNLSFQWNNYYVILTETFGLGIIPMSIYILWNSDNHLNKYFQKVNNTNQESVKQISKEENRIFNISTKLKNNVFTIKEQTFLFAQSDGNYTTVYCHFRKKSLHRISLNSLEIQLSEQYLIRCHRSYLVNLKKVEKIEGNAQGLKLHLSDCAELVPVSRKYIPIIKSHFKEVLS